MRNVWLGMLLLLAFAGLAWVCADAPEQGYDANAVDAGGGGAVVGLEGRPSERTPGGPEAAAALLAELAGQASDGQLEAFRRHPETIAFDAALAKQLVACLRSDNLDVSVEASRRLVQMGSRALPWLRDLLLSEEAGLRFKVRSIFDDWVSAEQVVLDLDYLALLESPHGAVIGFALGALQMRRAYDRALAARLVELANHAAEAWQGRLAKGVLAGMGPKGRELLRPLLAADLAGASTESRKEALDIMLANEADWSLLTPALLQVLEDEEEERALAFLALDLLARETARPESAIPTLIRLLSSPDESLASRAAEVLGLIAAQPEVVLPALLQSINEDGSEAAARALAAYGRQGYELALRVLRNGDPAAQEAALFVFAEQGAAAAAVVPEVLALIGGEDVLLSQRAIQTVGEIGPRASEAIPLILATLKQEPDPRTLQTAALALGRLGLAAEASLRAALGSSDPRQRRQALRLVALGFRGRAPFACAELEASLASKNETELYLAADALIVTLFYPAGFLQTPPGVEDRVARERVREVLTRLAKMDRKPAYYQALLARMR